MKPDLEVISANDDLETIKQDDVERKKIEDRIAKLSVSVPCFPSLDLI
jgi:hypothetical protein